MASLFLARDPQRVIAAAQKAGASEEQLGALKEVLSGGFRSSPVTVSAIAMALASLLLFVVGLWTRQAGIGFAAIVMTKGKDILRLMEALGALHRKYGLIYSVLWAAAVVSSVSLVLGRWHSWRGD
ncbi:hypothetical protein [Lacipirellula limnantheis]|nr:hypothetical protein [Lacipirellula limnantheis]